MSSLARLPNGRWAPGTTGNPGGRPHLFADVLALAREHTAAAIGTLAEIMADQNSPPATRVAAATALLDRGWGKPPQTVSVSEGTDLAKLSDAELEAVIRSRLAELMSELLPEITAEQDAS